MESTQGPARYIAGGVACPNPLEAALRAVLARVHQRAEAVGLPDVHFSTKAVMRHGELSLAYCLLATLPGAPWHIAALEAERPTLEETEAAFYELLSEIELAHYEANPCCYIDAQIESYQALEAAA